MNMDRRRILKGIAIICLAFIILASLIMGFRLVEKIINESESVSPDDAYSYSDSDGEIEYNGMSYLPKKKLETLLLLGIDSTESTEEDRSDSKQADFIVLVVMDKENETFCTLHINRDTMTDIRQIDGNGKEYGSFEGQLALAHVYGRDDKARCRNTVKVVENLLYGIEIDHYLSMTMDAIPILNDSVGGVTLTLLDDFTHVDPSFTEGTKVTLKGENALLYIRERGALEDTSNLNRMERQKQYISALLEKYVGIASEDAGIDAFIEANEYIVSDCSIDYIERTVERLSSYEYEGPVSFKGEAVVGDEFMEYYLDESAARETVIELFYTPKEG